MQLFRSIELQTPFYEPPSSKVAERWKEIAPTDFSFCMKAWQLITHTPSSPTYRRLKSKISPQEYELYGSFRPTEQVQLAWERTKEVAAILNAAVIVFQCPKSFLPDRENIRNLNAFFSGIDRAGSALAWEPRGDGWRPELVREICAQHNLIHCVDPFTSDTTFGKSLYWRLHGRGGYRYRYTDGELQELNAKLQRYGPLNRTNYIMFNNVYSREDAQRFLALTESL